MSKAYDSMSKKSRGAWVIHHGRKTAGTTTGSAEFPALDTAGKAASLLSHLAASNQATITKDKVIALGRAAGLNPNLDLQPLLQILSKKRVIDLAASGDVEVLGLTSSSTVQHAADIFADLTPTTEERAAILLAEVTSDAPRHESVAKEFISDEFNLSTAETTDFLFQLESFGFVDAEGRNADKLLFNGNLFRRDDIRKTERILSSLSSIDEKRVKDLHQTLNRSGCVLIDDAENILGNKLFEKLHSAGMFDVNHVTNSLGDFGFVTLPSAFHKYNDPIVDDAFDLAKALVSALTYGMTQSRAGRGQITMIGALLRKLINGQSVGPATAIGEDYKVLEMKGVIQVNKIRHRYTMRLLKKDIGEMALAVLTTGETASSNLLQQPFPGSISGYVGPEVTRNKIRKEQTKKSKRLTHEVLDVLRTQGGL